MHSFQSSFFLVLLVLLVSALAASVSAQTSETGLPPFGSFHGSGVDVVSLENGNLHIEIPVYTVHQRADSDITYNFVYDIGGFQIDRSPTTPTTFEWRVGPTPHELSGWHLLSNIVGPWHVDHDIVNKSCTYVVDDFTYTANYTVNTNYTMTDSHGTVHPFEVRHVDQPLSGCADQVGNQNSGYALDGTGIMIAIGANAYDTTITMPNDYGPRNGNSYISPGVSQTMQNDGSGNLIGVTMTYTDSNGASQRIQVDYATVAFQTHFCTILSVGSDPCYEYATTAQMPVKFTLPTGKFYQFTWSTDGNGDLLRLDLPTGGYIAYAYQTYTKYLGITYAGGTDGLGKGIGSPFRHYRGRRQVISRTVNDGTTSNTWTYTNGTIRDPLGNEEAHVFSSFGDPPDPPRYETQISYYQGTAAAGTLLRTINKDYNFEISSPVSDAIDHGDINIRLIRETTILENNLQTKVETDYEMFQQVADPTIALTATRLNPTEKREYAYGTGAPGGLLRRTTYAYLHTGNQNYLSRNIVRQVTATTVFDGAGTQVAQTVNEYDNYSHTGQPMVVSNAIQHDPAYTTSFFYRGNITATSHWRNTDGAMVTTTNQYDDAGNLISSIDPLSHKTTYDYTDSWANTACLPSGQTKAVATKITNALNQFVTNTYNSCTFTLAAETDLNGKSVSYVYDLMKRLTGVSHPDGGHTGHAYDDTQLLVTSNSLLNSGTSAYNRTRYDGLGRVKQTAVCEDGTAACATGISIDVGFDALGRTITVSNPYRTSSDPGTNGTTTTQYDALGRALKIIPADGSATSNNLSFSYAGNCLTATDQAGKSMRTCHDALGRLIEVDEPTPWPASSGTGSAAVSGTEQSLPGAGGTPGTGTVTISGIERSTQAKNCTQRLCTIYDIGGVQVTVNGFAKTYTYGQGSTSATAASNLASAFNGDANSPVTASASGTVLTLTGKVTGTASNYSLATNSWTNDPTDFTGSSFTATRSGATLTGGTNGGAPVYDTGTAWVTVNGFQALANYGQGSTASIIATAIAGVFNSSGSSPVTASVAGSALTLTAKGSGATTNYAVTTGSTTSQPSSFSSPSFSVSGASLSGGVDANPGSLSTPAVTLYSYDAIDNVTCIVQKAFDTTAFSTCATASAAWRPRAFTYNSLSQLLSESNPESGAVNYTYDNDGNMSTRAGLAPNQTGTTTVTTTFSYDALHRVTQKLYSDGVTPTVKYGYDGVAPAGCTLPTLTMNNPLGQRTGMCDGAGAEAWSFDIVANTGWKITDARTTNGVTKTTILQNNLIASPAVLTYPSGRGVTYSYDLAGRAISAVDATGPINYASSASYAPHGALASLTNGASLVSTLYYNNRLQPCRVSVKSSGNPPTSCAAGGSGNVMDFSYDFGLGTADNGNINALTNNRDLTRSQTFAYDALNRLSTAQTRTSGVTIPNANCWGLTFAYDAWANLLGSSISGPAGCSEPLALNVAVSTKNRLVTNTVAGQVVNYCYDSAGNLIHTVVSPSVCPASGPYQYVFDAENRLTSAGGVSYFYDGDGRRVRKSSGKLYWYGLGRNPLDETDAAGNTNNTSFGEYVFFNGKRIAKRDYQNNVSYYFADYLDNARVVTNSTGTILDDSDFYPFGGERAISSSSGNSYKFTGKERDSESGFDNFGARYFSSGLGRFNSVDPGRIGAILSHPQILNRYAYVGNNPLRFTDPDGQYPQEQHEFFTFWLAVVAQKYNDESTNKKHDPYELAKGAKDMDNTLNSTTGIPIISFIVNYKKHFGKAPTEVRAGYDGGRDAHLIEDHSGKNAPHFRGAWYHIWSNIKGQSVDTADSSFGGFEALGKALGIPKTDLVYSALEAVRKFANANNLEPFQITVDGQTLGEGPDKSWRLIYSTTVGNLTINVYQRPALPQYDYPGYDLPGEDPAEHDRRWMCNEGNPAACVDQENF